MPPIDDVPAVALGSAGVTSGAPVAVGAPVGEDSGAVVAVGDTLAGVVVGLPGVADSPGPGGGGGGVLVLAVVAVGAGGVTVGSLVAVGGVVAVAGGVVAVAGAVVAVGGGVVAVGPWVAAGCAAPTVSVDAPRAAVVPDVTETVFVICAPIAAELPTRVRISTDAWRPLIAFSEQVN